MRDTQLIVSLVALNGGEIVGKTRLQKMVYLLDQCGMNSGFDFEYYNFGPFSAELASTADFARMQGKIEVHERPGYYEVPYAVFSTTHEPGRKVGSLKAEDVRDYLRDMNKYTAVELELAATLAFLAEEGTPEEDVDDEVRQLKPVKATDKGLRRAHELLSDLGLE